MNIIGLGAAGCSIAKKFSQYPQYNVHLIDCVKRKGNCLKVPERNSHEEYEAKARLKSTFFEVIEGKCLFIVCGAESISGMSLRVLEKIRRQKIEILYIKPEVELLPEIMKLQERATFNILQQYARSGVFERMYVVENSKLEEILGDVQVIGYYSKLNELLVSTVHMINVYKNSESEVSTFSKVIESAKISTFGLVDIDTGIEKLFYDMEYPREKVYFYAINKSQLEEDGALFKKIREQVRTKVKDERMKVSYGIFSTDYPQNYVYSVAHATFIQGQEK